MMTIAPTTNSVAYQSAMRRPNARVSTRRRSRSGAEDIADATHRVQQLLLEWTIDFVAQPAHEYIHDVGLRIEVIGPHMRQDHRLRDDPAGIPHQILEQRELARTQVEHGAAAGYAARQEIEHQVVHGEGGRLRCPRGTSYQRLDARQELGEGERLGQIIVAAGLEAADPI